MPHTFNALPNTGSIGPQASNIGRQACVALDLKLVTDLDLILKALIFLNFINILFVSLRLN